MPSSYIGDSSIIALLEASLSNCKNGMTSITALGKQDTFRVHYPQSVTHRSHEKRRRRGVS